MTKTKLIHFVDESKFNHIGKYWVSKSDVYAVRELTHLPPAFNPTYHHVRDVSPRMAHYLKKLAE